MSLARFYHWKKILFSRSHQGQQFVFSLFCWQLLKHKLLFLLKQFVFSVLCSLLLWETHDANKIYFVALYTGFRAFQIPWFRFPGSYCYDRKSCFPGFVPVDTKKPVANEVDYLNLMRHTSSHSKMCFQFRFITKHSFIVSIESMLSDVLISLFFFGFLHSSSGCDAPIELAFIRHQLIRAENCGEKFIFVRKNNYSSWRGKSTVLLFLDFLLRWQLLPDFQFSQLIQTRNLELQPKCITNNFPQQQKNLWSFVFLKTGISQFQNKSRKN